MSRPTYNGRVSPTRRRRTGDPSLDDAVAAAAEAVGTAFADLDEVAPPPEEPAWMRDVPTATMDPSAPPPVVDPAAVKAKREARASEIVKASTPSRPAPSRRPRARC